MQLTQHLKNYLMRANIIPLMRPLHNLLRGRILLLRCSLYSRTGALLEANFDRSLQLCRGLFIVLSGHANTSIIQTCDFFPHQGASPCALYFLPSRSSPC